MTGAAELVAAVRTAKQFLTYVSAGPFQYAIAEALRLPDAYFTEIPRRPAAQARPAGGRPDRRPASTSTRPRAPTSSRPTSPVWASKDGLDFCRDLPERCGVVAVPNSVFYDDPDAGRSQVRFAFCKKIEVLEEAVVRLGRL